MTKVKKQIKKKFFNVEVPILKKEIELYGAELEDLNNRYVKLNLASELHGKSLDLKLKVSADKNQAVAKAIEAKLLQSYLRRLIRKGTDYVEDSFVTDSKEGKIKIQTFMITRMRVTRNVMEALRKSSKESIIEYVKDRDFEEIISDILNNKLQKETSIKLKKVYPLNFFEIKLASIKK